MAAAGPLQPGAYRQPALRAAAGSASTAQRPGGERWAIEVKRSLSPKLERGFHAACDDVQPTRKWLVYPGEARVRIGPDVWAVSPAELARGLASLA